MAGLVQRQVPRVPSIARRARPRETETVLAAGIPPDLIVLVAFLLLGLLGQALNALRARAAERARRRRPSAGEARESRGGAAGEPDVTELERSGAELWRRLLEGLEPEAARPEVVHVPPPAAPASEPERPAARAAEPVPGPALVEVLERAPAREIAVLAREPVLSAADIAHDLGSEMASLGEPLSADEDEAALVSSAAPARASDPALTRELWRAVVWSEILAPPLALRGAQGSLTSPPWSTNP